MTVILKIRQMNAEDNNMNILRDKAYLEEYFGKDLEIEDDHLELMDIVMLPHYGHLVCIEFYLQKYRHAIHNDTKNIGAILHHMSPIFDIPEDGMRLGDLSQSYKPIRSVWVNGPAGRECVGIGHYWKDEFILFNEFYLAEV
jgi:hypothetical protein